MRKLNRWIGTIIRNLGANLFRYKGVIAVAGMDERFIFQGVHMLFDSQPDKEWGDETRRNQLVFIGRNLDEESMREEFDKCLI